MNNLNLPILFIVLGVLGVLIGIVSMFITAPAGMIWVSLIPLFSSGFVLSVAFYWLTHGVPYED